MINEMPICLGRWWGDIDDHQAQDRDLCSCPTSVIHPFIHSSIYSSIHLYIYTFVHSSLYPSLHPSIYLSIYLYTYLYILPSTQLFMHPSTCASIHLNTHHSSIYPSTHSSIHPSDHSFSQQFLSTCFVPGPGLQLWTRQIDILRSWCRYSNSGDIDG